MHRPQDGRPWEDKHVRSRVGFFDEAHKRVAPYAHQLRLVLKDGNDLQHFANMCCTAEIQMPIWVRDDSIEVLGHQIFSYVNLRKIDTWLAKLDWSVAFQCEALLRNLRLNAIELLDLKSDIESLTLQGSQYASQVLRHFHTVLRSLREDETVRVAFARAVKEFEQLSVGNRANLGSAYFDAHHVSFTPTAMRLEGPYPHQSNRVVSSPVVSEFELHQFSTLGPELP